MDNKDTVREIVKDGEDFRAESENGLRAWGTTEEEARLNLEVLIEKEAKLD